MDDFEEEYDEATTFKRVRRWEQCADDVADLDDEERDALDLAYTRYEDADEPQRRRKKRQ